MRYAADSTNPADLPTGFSLYWAYDDGNYNNVNAVRQRFPHATVGAITVFARDDFGDCLDVENGDATPQQAPPWVQARRAAGHGGPLVYCSLALWSTVLKAFADAGVPDPSYWIAAYPGNGQQLYPGSVGHQFIDHGNWDQSVFADYLPGIDPNPKPFIEEEEMPLYATTSQGVGFVISTDMSHKYGVPDGTDAGALLATGLYKVVKLTDQAIEKVPGT